MVWHASRLARPIRSSGKDMGFYVFQLPWLEMLQALLLGLVRCRLIARVAVYVAGWHVRLDAVRGLRVGRGRRHLSLLAAALLLVLAFGAWLDVPAPAAELSGLLHGATNADVAVPIPALRVLLVAALVGAGLALVQIADRVVVAAAHGGGPLRAASAAAGVGAAALMQRFVIAPNEQVRETPYIEHNIAATRVGLRPRQRRGAGAVRRRAADARRHRRQRRHARQRPALGPPAAAPDLRADPGDPHLLRLRLGAQRPLHDQRRVPADHALGARAELREPAEPQLDQRAADLHPRLRRHARAGEPGDAGRPAGALHQGPAAAVVGGPARSPSRASTSASCRTTTCS